MDINEIYTIKEVAILWKIEQSVINHACAGHGKRKPRLVPGVECRKSGATWLITRSGAERLWGKLKEDDEKIR